ncbi:MAG: NuoI/complex I 23 kDa subunit family protein [Candidatus Syntropharchaeia archaeon]
MKGIAEGMGITFKHVFKKPVTVQYPIERPTIFERFRGMHSLDKEKCNACGLCARICPVDAIKVSSVKEDKKRILTGYVVDIGVCIWCGLCVDACPRDALRMTEKFELSAYEKEELKKDLFMEAEYA